MEQTAFSLARSKARELRLGMKIVDAHYAFDRSRKAPCNAVWNFGKWVTATWRN